MEGGVSRSAERHRISYSAKCELAGGASVSRTRKTPAAGQQQLVLRHPGIQLVHHLAAMQHSCVTRLVGGGASAPFGPPPEGGEAIRICSHDFH